MSDETVSDTPETDYLIDRHSLERMSVTPSFAETDLMELARKLERQRNEARARIGELQAAREALESIRIFARDCIDTGHDRGALGNLYAIVDLCDRHAALAASGEP